MSAVAFPEREGGIGRKGKGFSAFWCSQRRKILRNGAKVGAVRRCFKIPDYYATIQAVAMAVLAEHAAKEAFKLVGAFWNNRLLDLP